MCFEGENKVFDEKVLSKQRSIRGAFGLHFEFNKVKTVRVKIVLLAKREHTRVVDFWNPKSPPSI